MKNSSDIQDEKRKLLNHLTSDLKSSVDQLILLPKMHKNCKH